MVTYKAAPSFRVDGFAALPTETTGEDKAMAILAWTLGLPTVATVLAIGWVHWAARPRGPVEAHESVAAYERFKQAMAAEVSAGRKAS